MEYLSQWLERVGIKIVDWGERNLVVFDKSRYEIVAFTRRWKPDLKRRPADIRITVRGHTLGFNTDAIHWLRVYLNAGFQFKAHKKISLEKARPAENRVRRLRLVNGLAPGLI